MIAEFRWRHPHSGSSHLFQLANAFLQARNCSAVQSTRRPRRPSETKRCVSSSASLCVQGLFYILPSPRVSRRKESSVSRDSRSKDDSLDGTRPTI